MDPFFSRRAPGMSLTRVVRDSGEDNHKTDTGKGWDQVVRALSLRSHRTTDAWCVCCPKRNRELQSNCIQLSKEAGLLHTASQGVGVYSTQLD